MPAENKGVVAPVSSGSALLAHSSSDVEDGGDLEIEWNPLWASPNHECDPALRTVWMDGLPPDVQRGVARNRPDVENPDIPPAYYAESGVPVRIAKAFLMAFTSIAPYFAVFDQLSIVKPETWIPCSNHTCHYVRIFNSENIPGTGSNVMSVENGIERPIAMNFQTNHVFSCKYRKNLNKTRGYIEKIQFWKPSGKTCPRPHDFSGSKDHENTVNVIEAEQKRANLMTPLLKFSFMMNKWLFWAASIPMNWGAKTNAEWGMEHIPSGRCPKMSQEEMKMTCDKPETRRNVVNHLGKWSPSKYGLYVGLVGYALLTIIHDLMLMKSTKLEYYTLQVGTAATVCLGFSVAAVFMWAMGATEVFVAPVKGFDKSDCMCYYQLPELTALMGLATPFALYAIYRAQVQMRGLASLYGDYLNFITFIVPHYLARQSFLWTWGTMATPKAAGTVAPNSGQRTVHRVTFKAEQWKVLKDCQVLLYYGSNVLGVLIAFSSCSFMISFKEVCVSIYMQQNMTPLIESVIKYVLLPLPTVAVLGIGAYAMSELYSVTIGIEPGETMVGQFKVVVPSCCQDVLDKIDTVPSKDPPPVEKMMRWITFIVGFILLGGLTLACGQGLSPNLSFLMDLKGQKKLHWTSLAQAELWSACGFVFFLVHVPRVLTIAFSTWDDLESLKNLAEPGRQAQELAKKKTRPLE